MQTENHVIDLAKQDEVHEDSGKISGDAASNSDSDTTKTVCWLLAALAALGIIALTFSQPSEKSAQPSAPSTTTQQNAKEQTASPQNSAQKANQSVRIPSIYEKEESYDRSAENQPKKGQTVSPQNSAQKANRSVQENSQQTKEASTNYLQKGIQNFERHDYYLAAYYFEGCMAAPSSSSNDKARCANYLAHMISKGLGPKRDESEAFKLYSYAASLDYQNAQYNLAKCYKNGTGCNRDMSYAVYWYQKAASGNDRKTAVTAAKMLGYIYEVGLNDYSESKEYAYSWYKKAYELDPSDKDAFNALTRLQAYAK